MSAKLIVRSGGMSGKTGLILNLVYKARDYERRVGEVRQIQPLSRVADTLDTKARICKEMVMKLGGLPYGDDRSSNRRARRKTIRDTEEPLHIRHTSV